jgi:hypothetical protein
MAATITQQQFEEAAQQRAAARQRLADLLGSDGVLALPTAPGPAPLCNTSGEQLDAFRTSLISLTCIAGLSGFPQVCAAVLLCCYDGGRGKRGLGCARLACQAAVSPWEWVMAPLADLAVRSCCCCSCCRSTCQLAQWKVCRWGWA